ncbi:MAG: riboflavin kinase [Rikenellaceae bacterium]
MIIRGVVLEGKKLGRKLGFPTANINISESLQIENGVYLSIVCVDGERFLAVTNIGNNPTVGGLERKAESHLLDFSGDLYNREIEVDLGERLRGEMRFESVEALREQVLSDIAEARERLQ